MFVISAKYIKPSIKQGIRVTRDVKQSIAVSVILFIISVGNFVGSLCNMLFSLLHSVPDVQLFVRPIQHIVPSGNISYVMIAKKWKCIIFLVFS